MSRLQKKIPRLSDRLIQDIEKNFEQAKKYYVQGSMYKALFSTIVWKDVETWHKVSHNWQSASPNVYKQLKNESLFMIIESPVLTLKKDCLSLSTIHFKILVDDRTWVVVFSGGYNNGISYFKKIETITDYSGENQCQQQ